MCFDQLMEKVRETNPWANDRNTETPNDHTEEGQLFTGTGTVIKGLTEAAREEQ